LGCVSGRIARVVPFSRHRDDGPRRFLGRLESWQAQERCTPSPRRLLPQGRRCSHGERVAVTARSPPRGQRVSRRSYSKAARDGFDVALTSDWGKFLPTHGRARIRTPSRKPSRPRPALARTPRGLSSSMRRKAQFQLYFNVAPGALRRGRRRKGRGTGGPARTVQGSAHRSQRARPLITDPVHDPSSKPGEGKSRASDRRLGRERRRPLSLISCARDPPPAGVRRRRNRSLRR
jgi:hypothetical protein